MCPSFISGLDRWYTFAEGSGSTVHDMTANGHDVTIAGGGTAAVWQPRVGLALNGQTITIPSSAGIPTIGICAYFPANDPVTGAFSVYSYYSTTTVGSQGGFSMTTSYGAGTGHGFSTLYPSISIDGTGSVTSLRNGVSGNHCIEYIIGNNSGTLDAIIVDGVEGGYDVHGTSYQHLGGSQLTNSATMQSSMNNGTFTNPTIIYSAWNSSARHTIPVGINKVVSEMKRLSSLGVVFGNPIASSASDSSCTIQGTSIDQGFTATARPSSLLALTFPCTITDFSVSGQPPRDMTSTIREREAKVYRPLASRNIAYNGGVTNGVMNELESPADALIDTIGWSRALHAIGYRRSARRC